MEEDLKAYLSSMFGKEAKDKTTGFVGKVTATALYLGGNQRVELSAVVEGKLVEYWFDADRIELTGY